MANRKRIFAAAASLVSMAVGAAASHSAQPNSNSSVDAAQPAPISQPSRDTGPQEVASLFWAAIDAADPAEVYRRFTTPLFKAQLPEQAFVERVGVIRIQFGGVALATALVGGQTLSFNQMGQPAEGYYIRHRARYPSGQMFLDLYLERTAGEWKIGSFNVLPAPNL